MSEKYYKVTITKVVKLHLIVAIDPDKHDIDDMAYGEIVDNCDDIGEFDEDSIDSSYEEISKRSYDIEVKEGMWIVYEPDNEYE